MANAVAGDTVDTGDEQATTHVVYQGKHYVLPGNLTPQDAYIRVRNLAGAGPKVGPIDSPDQAGRPLTDDEQAALDAAEPARYGISKPDDWGTMGKAVAAAAAPSLGAAALPVVGEALNPYAQTAIQALSKAAPTGLRFARVGGRMALEGIGYAAADKAMSAVGVPPGVRYALLGAWGLKPLAGAIRAVATRAAVPALEAAAPAAEAAVPAAARAVAPVATAARTAAAAEPAGVGSLEDQLAASLRARLTPPGVAAPSSLPAVAASGAEDAATGGVLQFPDVAGRLPNQASLETPALVQAAREGRPGAVQLIIHRLSLMKDMPNAKAAITAAARQVFGDEAAPGIVAQVFGRGIRVPTRITR